MNYSLEQITTAADCDELLSMVTSEKSDLAYSIMQQSRQYQTITNGTTTVEAQLAAVTSEISSLETVLETLPEGDTKVEFQSRLVKLRHKKFLLEERRERYNVLALLQKEYTISCIEKQQAETDFFLSEVNRRKEEIG